ncbi:MAG TPA: hypothetical protein VNK48_10350 [Xanthobacteraceae bacterium]|nr:hypothetical protein [Xanthobacteraceae bacterium]
MTGITAIARAQAAGGRYGLAWFAAIVLAVAVTSAVTAQDARQDTRPPQQVEQPGVLESIARWLERGLSSITGGLGNAKNNIDSLGEKAATAGRTIGETATEAGKSAADATKGAVDEVMKLPTTRMVQGHVRCDISPNGAPDCRSAALSLCASKGFSKGTSVDFVAAEKCPPAVWMQRRKPEPGECVTETFVTRALCQ